MKPRKHKAPCSSTGCAGRFRLYPHYLVDDEFKIWIWRVVNQSEAERGQLMAADVQEFAVTSAETIRARAWREFGIKLAPGVAEQMLDFVAQLAHAFDLRAVRTVPELLKAYVRTRPPPMREGMLQNAN